MPFDNLPPTKTEDELVIDGLVAVMAGAKKILASPKRWWQGSNAGINSDGEPAYCIQQAAYLAYARQIDPEITDLNKVLTIAPRDMCDAWVKEIIERFLDGVVRSHWPGCKGVGCHVSWNDDPHRQHEDVLLALDYAIAEAPNWVQHYRGY